MMTASSPNDAPVASTPTLDEALADWLAHGGRAVGQVRIVPHAGAWELRHEADDGVPTDDLELHSEPEAARVLALYDAAGNFRPLKAAPTLRRGWRLRLGDIGALRRALDYFYPAAVGNWVRFTDGTAGAVPLRDTLNRQTGMYRITALLTDDEAVTVVRATCDFATQCRRRIAWPVSEGHRLEGMSAAKTTLSPGGGELPILCLEGCNWLVAAARSAIKKMRSP